MTRVRILLLGRSGQVGFELQRLLASRADVQAHDRATADLEHPESIRALVRDARAEVIINAAAYTAVDAAEKDEARAQVVNAEAPGVLAEEAARTGALLVHYSTDYVFDGTKREPYREDDVPAPASAYGRTKLAGEAAIRASGCRHLILRTSWVYAPRGRNFVLTMLKLARERPELRVVADQVGSPTSARSLAAATVHIVERTGEGTYHATGGGVTSWHGFAQLIISTGSRLGLCPPVPVRPIATADYPTPARRPAYSVLDNARLQAEQGVRLPDWTAALDECLAEIATLTGVRA
jgi:dTDP-4-dehydrorhamnose reductase